MVSEMRLEELEGKLGFLGDALTAMARLDAYIVAEKVGGASGQRDATAWQQSGCVLLRSTARNYYLTRILNCQPVLPYAPPAPCSRRSRRRCKASTASSPN